MNIFPNNDFCCLIFFFIHVFTSDIDVEIKFLFLFSSSIFDKTISAYKTILNRKKIKP